MYINSIHMSKRVYSPPCAGATIEMRLETDLLAGASAIGLFLATGQGVEEYSPYSDGWDDVPWD